MPSRVDSKRLGRGIAERDQHVRVHQFDLALDERQADLRFLRRRGAVAGRPPRNHIGDVGLAAVEPDRRDHAVEQLAGTADERQALDVLVAPGRLADEHDARLRIAVGEHQPRGGVFQRAAVEFFQQRRAAPPATARFAPLPAPRRSRLPAPARPRRAEPGRLAAPRRAGWAAPVRLPPASRRPGPRRDRTSRLTGSSASAQSTPASR